MTYRRSSRRDDSLRFEGHEYEIDLKAKNAMALRAVFNDYTGTARKGVGRQQRQQGQRSWSIPKTSWRSYVRPVTTLAKVDGRVAPSLPTRLG